MATIYYSRNKLGDHDYYLGATAQGLCFVGSWEQDLSELKKFYPQADLVVATTQTQVAASQLAAYLAGQRHTFDLALAWPQGTDLQQATWQALLKIPYGATVDYTTLAQQAGYPRSVRAVASAVGKNPLLIIAPCHRVLRKDGSQGGYRGGLAMKQALLILEQAK
ncbi:methylated-DNA--[protein]-cysteine S-methyltransferase [Loigolactobacillus zhaoyuanensis]|uniref:methylated-DNA--[protein]-cysteine S-methyltransferase n=1 Tax=Loigolactobacillus zhaoyuanensis TaxID=2486017 RepID=UPI000F737BB3|nr:methylated-DNA--[protein]-cysteine S-methyltransferase [Loigolactobacillus zhaoyuanensis]